MKFDCELYKRLSIFISGKLYLYVQKKIDKDELEITHTILCAVIQTLYPKKPCVSCEGCLDFRYYGKLLIKTVKQDYSIEFLEQDLYSYENCIVIGDMLNNQGTAPSKKDFNYQIYSSTKPCVYFDFNISDRMEKEFPKGSFSYNKSKFDVFYSPIHLEEVYRMDDDEFRNERIQTIRELTDCHLILNIDSKLSKFTEEPCYSYKRVLRNLGISKAVENARTVEIKKRDVLKKENITLAKTINNAKDVFDIIPNEEINFSIQNLNTEPEIRNAIYSLYRLLDLYSYKRDSKERTVRSSIYDIEHLVYATACDYFVTEDKNLRSRAEQIYRKISIKTKVVNYNELKKI